MTVLQERRGRVHIITLNRPEKRNALDAATTEGLGNTLLDAERDPDVAVVVLTGAGDRAFCAGLDLSTVGTKREPTEGSARYMSFITDGYPKPVIAAVNGTTVAGGFELMLACDLAVVAQHATFGIPEVKRGLIAGAGGTLLPLRLPMPIALEARHHRRSHHRGACLRGSASSTAWCPTRRRRSTTRSRWPSGSARTAPRQCAPPAS